MGRNRPKGGLLGGFDQLRAPDAPEISVTEGSAQLIVAFTNPSDVGGGAISSYVATAIASGVSTGATSASSPVTITGLTNGTSYSVTGLANNAFGASPYSSATSASPSAAIGIFMGGSNGAGSYYNTIQTIDIGTTSNASDFGDLTQSKEVWDGVAGNATRSISFGGNADGATNVIEYVNPTSAGNGQDFGDMPVDDTNVAMAALANNTRAIYQRKEVSLLNM